MLAQMPLNDYECGDSGPFPEWCPMSEWDAAIPCPDCALPLPTQAAAAGSSVDHNRLAHERKERTSREREVVRREDRSRNHRHSRYNTKTLVTLQLGTIAQSVPGRPWRVGH